MNYRVSTDNGLRMTEMLTDIDHQIQSLKNRKQAIKKLKPRIRAILEEHQKASWGKGKYAKKFDVDGKNQAYDQLMIATNELKAELEALGFTVSDSVDWSCLELI